MKTPADAPSLSEYLPALRYLLHLDGAKVNPDLLAPETTLPPVPAGLPFPLDLAAEVLPDFGIL